MTTRWGHAWTALRATGHALFFVVMVGVFVAFVVMGVIGFVGRDRPVHWGTFTETSTVCDRGSRAPCTQTGRWVSDDGSIVKDGVTLDGSVARGGTVRASYQPGGPMRDDANNVVHTGTWSSAGLWFPWVAALGTAFVTWRQHRRWHGDRRRALYPGRHADSA